MKRVEKIKLREIEEKYALASYTAWQLGAGRGMTFGNYLRYLGIYDLKPKIKKTKEQLEAEKNIALEEAVKIIALDKKRKVIN